MFTYYPDINLFGQFFIESMRLYTIIKCVHLSDINGTVNESIQGMPIIQAFRQERETKKEFDELNGDYFKYQNKILNLNAATSHNLVGVLRNIAFTGVIWYFGGASLSASGIISLRDTVCVR